MPKLTAVLLAVPVTACTNAPRPDLWRRFQFSIFAPDVQARVLERREDPAAGREYLDTLKAFFKRQLFRARRFVWSLTVPVPDVDVRYVVFGGNCSLTPARIPVEEVDGVSMVRLWPEEVTQSVPGVDYDRLVLEPGDGVVTKASLLSRQSLDPTVARHRYSFFPLRYSFFRCESHDRLTGNITFQDNLLNALLSADED